MSDRYLDGFARAADVLEHHGYTPLMALSYARVMLYNIDNDKYPCASEYCRGACDGMLAGFGL